MRRLSLLLLVLLLFRPVGTATSFPARVFGISDRDTSTVLCDNTQTKIRLHGIDCPEKGQTFGQKAK